MKKNHIGLFIVGIIMGGAIMAMILGGSQITVFFRPKLGSIPTSIPDQLPRVIALESTSVPRAILPTLTLTAQSSPSPRRTAMKFITEHNLQVLISYHSAALGVFPGGFPWEDNSTRLAESIEKSHPIPFRLLTQDVRIQVHLRIMRYRPGLPL